ncbi:peptidase dimerization domain-containing protein [Saccharopolyspora hattusasensis]|uniref:peptidase dimerization domain-containing protein n=1 Tax=Saccharopolyspora hattusasensis TaxID=1128679 RepID=UPI003D99C4CA
MADLVDVILRNSANPTMIEGGYQTNVIPGRATAAVDGRFLPGHEQELLDTIDSPLLPSVRREVIHHDVAMQTEFSGTLVDAICAAIRAEDPDGHPAPYCNAGGTDKKAFATIGINGFGFKALRVPPDLPYSRMFHGVDERIPLESLRFSTPVMQRLLQTC